MLLKVHRTLKVQFDSGEAREETLLGRDYLVVPVIAMVEGVRYGANQSGPELGLASEFGDNPIMWANRPLVLNHPQDEDGDYVSANSPSILESYQFGMTMNPEVKDDKLHMEAWIDIQRVEDLGGEFEETYDRIVAEEEVEVSVGFFSDIVKQKGKFKGQVYSAVWRNIKPDHLAVLSEGITGACSVKDGCGIPRINQKDGDMPKLTADQGCQCDGACQCEGHEHAHTDEPVAQGAKPKKATKSSVPSVQSTEPVAEDHADHRTTVQAVVDAHIRSLKISSDMYSGDIQKLVGMALRKKFGSGVWLYGYTNDYAIFEQYDNSSYSYTTKKIGINVENDVVEFVGDAEEVVLLTKIVSAQEASVNSQQENNMSGKTTTTQQGEPATPETPATAEATTTTEKKEESSAPAPAVQASPKKLTAQEYVAEAPDEIREVLQSSMKLHAEKKAECINVLKAAPGNKFTEDFLKTQSLDMLENMVALIPGSYAGQGAPTQPNFVGQAENSNTVPAPRVFSFGKPEDKSEQAA